MLKSLSFFIKYFFFWVLFFVLCRVFFEIANYQTILNTSFTEVFTTFSKGILMDFSMAGYFCALPFLLTAVLWFFNIKIPHKSINIYTYILIFLSSAICIIDINIYREWGTKFNAKAFDFLLDSPNEAIASTYSSPILYNFLGLILLLVLGVFLYKLISNWKNYQLQNLKFASKFIVSLIILSLTFLAIRGGIGIAPMNTSKVYFSSKPILNIAAINTNWFLMSNIISQSKSKGNPYQYYPNQEALAVKDSLFLADSLAPSILKIEKPNVVLLILESFTADLFEELGGEKGITPNFTKLIDEGLLFTQIYSASDRTDKGLVATISAFPSQAIQSIIKQNDKQSKLPSIAQSLKDSGYQTSFIYGGDLNFSNFKSYLMSHGFDKVDDISNIKTEEKLSKWGVEDEVTFNELSKKLAGNRQPFFSTMLTLTNHEPFYLKGNYRFGKSNAPSLFKSTAYYTDSVIYDFVQQSKKTAWYSNTLFVVIADHGHRLPTEKKQIYEPGRYHIPLLLFGGALKDEYRNQKINKVGNQVDLASTLLNQLNITDTAYHYSKNLLSPAVKGFAFYAWDNGFGFMNDKMEAVSYDPVGKSVIYKQNLPSKSKEKELEKISKSLIQIIYQDYLDF